MWQEGLESALLKLFLARRVLPRVVFVDVDALCCCFGTRGHCERLRKEAGQTIAALTAAGYAHASYRSDYSFFRLDRTASRTASNGDATSLGLASLTGSLVPLVASARSFFGRWLGR